MRTLVARISAGDRFAESELVRLFSGRIRSLLRFRVANPDEAQDLFQDVILSAIENLRKGQLREPDRLPAYLATIARNVSSDWVRQKMRTRALEQDELDASQAISLAAGPEAASMDREQQLQMDLAMSELDATDRRILTLTLVESEKPGRIATLLGLDPALVRQRKCRAIQKIADLMRANPHAKAGAKGPSIQ